ncbi:hypothetical protein GLOTRDRAFT_95302 [Gloeophyllum trabeum ATCC 11539]|uniref:Uncharacterized protein n=1 Tax=Gloeophyllum trabeum (strain ATCC 11539 / FP-39264 / Madison 617) TaxID=670483 RepID=S7Q1E4_GLOTA|nr:uncharacterized protein GLOTRDRAFT_95302 [Gloeophyllum trabeum ATCC 11539]EPQ53332.1 hypothetical protein GLOTRDRAFT_95302 [Gloeophyllum trabeum ATCC 11539]
MAYIEALLTFIPEAATVFDQRGLQQHLKALIGRLSSLGYLQDTEDRLLASSRRALVSTANAKMLAMIQDYSAIEVTCEDKLDQALLSDRLLPYLASFTSATFSSEAAYNSHLPALPIIKSFTRQPGPFWLHWVLTSSPHSFISAVNMRQWLWTAIAEKDLVRRALMLRIINSVLGSIGRDDMSVGASPWIWESVWLPVCEVVLARAGNTEYVYRTISEGTACADLSMSGGQKRRRRMRLRDALDLQLGTMRTPCSLTVTLERQLLNLANKAESVRPPAPLPGIFDTVRSPVYRVFARFLYERRVIALGAREYCPLGFPAKGLCERVTGLLTGFEDVPEEVLVICRKDKDYYEALLGSLRHARHGLSGREFDRVSKVLDRLASSRYEPSVVKLQLESKIQDAAHGYPNDEGRTHIGSRFYRSVQTRAVGFYPRLVRRYE